MSSQKILHLDSTNFNETIEANKLVLVDFWAPWCGPCKAIAPILDQLAEEMPDVCIAKVNVDTHGQLASQFNVKAIPTLVIFKEAKPVETMVGLSNKEELKKKIESHA